MHFLNMDRSTISTILKIKGKIMEHVKSAMLMMSIIILKKCGTVMEEMEKLLRVQRQSQHQCRVQLSLMLIQEETKRLYEDLKMKHSKESEGLSSNAQPWLVLYGSRQEPIFMT